MGKGASEVIAGMREAVAALERGGIAVFPTETVCGVGCRLDRPDAIRRLYRLKGRPQDKPLQVLLPRTAVLDYIAEVPPEARVLVDLFTPGPLTLVLPSRIDVPELGGRGTVGVRVPDHPVALELLDLCGPAAASSANPSSRPTPATVAEVRGLFGDAVDAYVDGPPAPAGRDSTVLDLSGGEPRVLREGALPVERIEQALGIGVRGGGC